MNNYLLAIYTLDEIETTRNELADAVRNIYKNQPTILTEEETGRLKHLMLRLSRETACLTDAILAELS